MYAKNGINERKLSISSVLFRHRYAKNFLEKFIDILFFDWYVGVKYRNNTYLRVRPRQARTPAELVGDATATSVGEELIGTYGFVDSLLPLKLPHLETYRQEQKRHWSHVRPLEALIVLSLPQYEFWPNVLSTSGNKQVCLCCAGWIEVLLCLSLSEFNIILGLLFLLTSIGQTTFDDVIKSSIRANQVLQFPGIAEFCCCSLTEKIEENHLFELKNNMILSTWNLFASTFHFVVINR